MKYKKYVILIASVFVLITGISILGAIEGGNDAIYTKGKLVTIIDWDNQTVYDSCFCGNTGFPRCWCASSSSEH